MKSHSVKVSESGRICLPAEVRRALGIVGPGHLVLTMEDGEVRLSTVEQALARVQSLARPFRPKTGLASDQLISERRQEARRDEEGRPGPRKRTGGRRG